MSILDEDDLYIILGLQENASADEITRAYKELAKKYHPDKFANSPQYEKEKFTRIFTKITNAFNTLKDSNERERYDYERELKKKIKTADDINYMVVNEQQDIKPQTQNEGINIKISFTDSKQTSKDIKEKKEKELFEQGLGKFKKGAINESIGDFQALIELNPKIAIYHSYLGLAMKKKGWNGYAQAEFRVALNYDPKDKIALENFQASTTVSNRQKKEEKDTSLLGKVKNLFKKN